MLYIIHKLRRIIGLRIYCNARVLLMVRSKELTPTSAAIISLVDSKNIQDAANFQSARQLSEFRKYIKQGHEGYYGYWEGKCVHRSWLVRGPERVSLHKFYSMEIHQNEIFIQNCETASDARGKNIFAHVLAKISQQYSEFRVLTSVDVTNMASQRSMEKAGFEPISVARIRVILGFKAISIEPKSR